MTMPAPAGGSNNRQAQVTVTANVDPFNKSMGAAAKAAAAFGTALKAVDDAIFRIAKRAGVAAMGGGALALFGDIKDLQRAAQTQTAITQLGVQSGVTGKQLDSMGKSVMGLSATIPASSDELLRLATQLAAVGVNGPKQLAALTAQAERLAAATNTAPGELLTGLVQVGASLGNSLESVTRYGDSLTTLQQKMGASASGTLQFVGAISAVGAKAGMGEASLLGFAGAFQKLGIDSASGAQAFNTIVNDMSDAVARGTTRMTLYSNALGESSTAFKKNFENDPAGEFVKFVNVIASQGAKGGQTLDQFGLDGARMIRVFASLSNGAGNLQTALNDANSGFAAGDATARASAQAYDTFNNKLTIMHNGFNRVKESIGQGFIPMASRAVGLLGNLSNAAGTVAEYLSSIHLPVIGDWTSRWAGVAAGVGLAAGAFGLFAAGITKFLGVWRVMSGVVGGSAIRGLAHGFSRGSIGNSRMDGPMGMLGNPINMNPLLNGRATYARGMEAMPGASRTQLWMYRNAYRFGAGMRHVGPMVDPDASRIGRRGLIRGGVGAVAGFPLQRMRQIMAQAKDTALHPMNAANRDQMATDPFSVYGGYQQLVRGGKNAREMLIKHLSRDGASQAEKNMAEGIKRGFGDKDESAQRLKFDRERLGQATYKQTYAQQTAVNSRLTREQAIELLHRTDLAQMASGQKDPRDPEADFSKLSNRKLKKHLANQATWAADNAHKDALNEFDSKLDDKDTAKLSNPFQKLATKVKEITGSLTADTGNAFSKVMAGLKSFFEKALAAVVRTAQKMYAEVVRLKTLAGGGSADEAKAAAKEAGPAPLIGTARRSTPRGGAAGAPGAAPGAGPTAPQDVSRPAGFFGTFITEAGPGRLPHSQVDPSWNGVIPEAVANRNVDAPDRKASRKSQAPEFALGPNSPGLGQKVVSGIDTMLGKEVAAKTVDTFGKAMDTAKTKVMAMGGAVRDFTVKLGTQYAMQLMMWVPILAGGFAALANSLQQTARDSQFAGQEIQKSLGRQWLSPTELAQQRAQAHSNKADQDPWGATERKDAKGTQFASDHADTLKELETLGGKGKPKGTQAVLQQEVNALVQQTNGSPVDAAGQQAIRQLLMTSGLSKSQQHAVYNKLDWTGHKNSDIYDVGLNALNNGKGLFYNTSWGAGKRNLQTLATQAAADTKLSNDPSGAALMLLNSDPHLGGYAHAPNHITTNTANALVSALNNGTKDDDPGHIAPDNKIFPFMGLGREMNTASSVNGFLDQLAGGKGGSKAFGESLISAFKDAGLHVDKLGHVSGDTAKALEVLKKKAGNINGGDLQLASMQSEIQTSRASQIYSNMIGVKDSSILGLTGNNQAIDYSVKMHEVNQQLINDGAKAAAAVKGNPYLDTNTGVTSPGYIAGLKNAIQEIQRLQNAIGTPTQADYQNLEALKQEDMAKMSGLSSTIESPGQQMKDSADILNSLTQGGVTANNSALVVSTTNQLGDQYAQGVSSLKQYYTQWHETQIQMQRSADDFHHSMANSERDYNRSVKENNYQFNVQQTESLYQYKWSLAQRQYSFNEQIRSTKYSMANAFGNAGQMVQAQYTQGAEGSLIGMTAQNKLFGQSKSTLDKLAKSGLSKDAIRVMKLDDPTNVAEAQRLLQDFTSNPKLIKSFNESVAKRLSLTKAIASDPNNSQYADMKRQFDKAGSDASKEFTHAQKVASTGFDHSMKESAKSYGISMGDFTYQFNLQTTRTKEDMGRMAEYISMSVEDLTSWAKGTGIPGLQDIAEGMAAIAASMDASTKAQQLFLADQKKEHDADDQTRGDGAANAADHKDGFIGPVAPDPRPKKPKPPVDPITGKPIPYDPISGKPWGGGGAALDPPSYYPTVPAVKPTHEASKETDAYTEALKKAKTAVGDARTAIQDGNGTLDDQKTKQHDAETAILDAVDAAGKKADADNKSKDPAARATAVVKAQRDTFDELTGKLGGIPGALTTLGTSLHSSQDPMTTTTSVAGDLKTAIDKIPKDPKITMTADTSGATGAVDTAHEKIRTTISSIIDLLFGSGFTDGWNWIASHLGLDSLKIPKFNKPKGFATGGYTGDGRRHDVAGEVHAGEFVFDQEKTRKHRPLFERIHRGDDAAIPSYAKGGAVVTWPQLDAVRKQLFPNSVLTDSTRPGASDYHGRGMAIDIGYPGNAQSGLMPIAAQLAATYPNSTELIHNPNGSIKNGRNVPGSFWGASTWAAHADHVHWAMTPEALNNHGSGGGSAKGSKMTAADAFLHPIEYLRSLGTAARAALDGQGIIGKAGAAAPGKAIDGISSSIGDWIGNLVSGAGNWIAEKASGLWGKARGLASEAWNFITGGSDTKDKVKGVAKAAGWDKGAQWNALSSLISHESGWNPKAQNPGSTAYGLFQFLDGTWPGTGIAKTSDVTKQAEAGLNYIHSRYKTPVDAWSFWNSHTPHWYGKGGLFTSAQTIGVGEAGPEAVLPLNSAGAQFMAQTLKASAGLMGVDPSLAQTLRSGRTSQYASPARSEMHIHHTDASTNFHGDITVVAQDPNEMARKLAEKRRMQSLTNPGARR